MNNNELVRLFVAVDMPPEVVDEIKRFQKELSKQKLFEGRFTQEHQMHITLTFIGEVAAQQQSQIMQALRTIEFKKMKARLGSVDVFTKGRFVKIIFMHLVCPELSQLAQKIILVLSPWVEPEERDFVSHLTVARVKKVANVETLLEAIDKLDVAHITFEIDSFILKQSVLSPSGPEYTDIATYFAIKT